MYKKRKSILLYLIKKKNNKILKKYFYKYYQQILIDKTKESIYKNLSKPKKIHVVHIRHNTDIKNFNFNSIYKNNILKDVVSKNKNLSIIHKYFVCWKEKVKINSQKEQNKKIKKINVLEIKSFPSQKNKKHIKIKYLKQRNQHTSNNDNFSSLSMINSSFKLNTSNNNNMIGNTKKMKVNKLKVDSNYYNYISEKRDFPPISLSPVKQKIEQK